MFRFVHVSSRDDDIALVEDFRSDREVGKPPWRREKVYPELRDGMSVFGSLQAARDQWQTIRASAEKRGQEIKAGHFIAEVLLEPENGFDIEDLGEPDEHLTIWGAPQPLAQAVQAIYPASMPSE